MTTPDYETDFYTWTQRQAAALRAKEFAALDLEHLAVDGCITKAPCGGQVAGPSPVDRRSRG